MKYIKKNLTNALAVTTVMLSALSGCASTSGTFEVTPGTYRVTATATASFGGQAKATGDAYKSATSLCAKQTKKIQIIEEKSNAIMTGATTDLTFRCVEKT